MKKVLITGKGSYIGTSFIKWVAEKHPREFETEELDMIDYSWRDTDFSQYDVVFHVAGVAHIKETKKNRHLYYEVNRDLAIETAKKAKKEGAKQFVLLSSMSVYGKNVGTISRETFPNPKSHYGKSKYQAEKVIEKLEDENFKIAILRPPMVYGEGCKGNYQILRKFAIKSPVFPDYRNKRSMIHISVLNEHIVDIMQKNSEGFFFPQNPEYVCTSELVEQIASDCGKRIRLTKLFDPCIRLALKMRIGVIEKVFGDLTYEK